MMKFGVNVPPFDDFCEPAVLVEMAQEAEAAGWDGFFIWDHMIFDDLWHPMVDPFVVLAAVAAQTTTIRLGTMVTPLARRRPWKVARETVGGETGRARRAKEVAVVKDRARMAPEAVARAVPTAAAARLGSPRSRRTAPTRWGRR